MNQELLWYSRRTHFLPGLTQGKGDDPQSLFGPPIARTPYEGPMEDRSDGSQYQQLALERMGLGCLRITA